MGDEPEDLVGTELAGRFTLLRLLGRGGMGAVFESHHPTLNRRVAIKVILPGRARDDFERQALRARFRREAQVTSNIQHHHVIQIFDSGEDDALAMPFLVMEFLEGRDLDSVLEEEERAGRRLAPRRAVRILSQICLAMDEVHRRGQVHRDLKPSNVMLITRGKDTDFVKVLDFGLARGVDDASRLTRTGAQLGTPLYMAPEQWRGERSLGPGVDIYALGAVAYHALSGRLPFEARTIEALMMQHVTAKQAPLHQVVPDIVPALSDAIDRAMEKRPEARFASMDDFREALESGIRATARRAVPAAVQETALPEAKPADDARPVARPAALAAPDLGLGETVPAHATPAAARVPAAISGAKRKLERHALSRLGPAHSEIFGAGRPSFARGGNAVRLLFEWSGAGSTQAAVQSLDTSLSSGGTPSTITREPAIALAPHAVNVGASLLVAWVDSRQRDGGSAIYVGSSRPERIEPSVGRRLSDGQGTAYAASFTPCAGDCAMLAWHELGASGLRTLVATVDESGAPAGAPLAIPNAACPSIACSGTSALLAWHVPGERLGQNTIALATLSPRGSLGPTFSWADPRGAFPVVAARSDGGFGVMWWSGGKVPQVLFARVSSAGDREGDPVRIGDASTIARAGALLRVDGGFVATWIGQETASQGAPLLAAYLGDGLPACDPIVIDRGNPTHATLALADDRIFAAWQTRGDLAGTVGLATLSLQVQS